MPTSSVIANGDLAIADHPNNIRTDVLSTHNHDGTEGTATIAATTMSATTVTLSNQLDVEGHMVVGNGSAPSANATLIIDQDFTPGSGVGQQLLIRGNLTSLANQAAFHALIDGGTIITAAGTHGLIATLNLDEPDIDNTAGATITTAATFRVADAPTEGTNNYAIFVDSGTTRLDGELEYGTGVAVVAGNYSVHRDADGTNQLHLNVPTGATTEFSVNDVAQMVVGPSSLTGNVVGTGASQVSVGDHTHSGSIITVIKKVVDESVTSSTTFQNDDDFLFSIGASEVWQVTMALYTTGTDTGGLKITWSLPTGATFDHVSVGSNINQLGTGTGFGMRTEGASSGTSRVLVDDASSNLADAILLSFMITNSTTPGTAQFQWAQHASNATATTLESASHMAAIRV